MPLIVHNEILWGWEARATLAMLAADRSPTAECQEAMRKRPEREPLFRAEYAASEAAFAQVQRQLAPLTPTLRFLFTELPTTGLLPIAALTGNRLEALRGVYDQNALLAAHSSIFREAVHGLLNTDDILIDSLPPPEDLRGLFQLLRDQDTPQEVLSALLRVTTEAAALLDCALPVLRQTADILRRHEEAFRADSAGILAMAPAQLYAFFASLQLTLSDDLCTDLYPCSMSPGRIELRFQPNQNSLMMLGTHVVTWSALAAEVSLSRENIQEALRMMTDKTKLDILTRLAARAWYGAELAEALSLSGATISHHMGQLLAQSLVAIESVGTRLYYRLNPARVRELLDALSKQLLL